MTEGTPPSGRLPPDLFLEATADPALGQARLRRPFSRWPQSCSASFDHRQAQHEKGIRGRLAPPLGSLTESAVP